MHATLIRLSCSMLSRLTRCLTLCVELLFCVSLNELFEELEVLVQELLAPSAVASVRLSIFFKSAIFNFAVASPTGSSS